MSNSAGCDDRAIHIHTYGPDPRMEQALQLLQELSRFAKEQGVQAMVKFADIQSRVDQLVTQAELTNGTMEKAVAVLGGNRAILEDIRAQLQNALDNGDDAMIQGQLDRMDATIGALASNEQALATAIAAPQEPNPPGPTPPEPVPPPEPVAAPDAVPAPAPAQDDGQPAPPPPPLTPNA